MARSTRKALILVLGLNAAHAFPVPEQTEAARFEPPLVAVQGNDERAPGPADLEEAIEIALKRYGGQAADADTVVRDGRRVHEIRVLSDDGSVRTVRVDPDTGAIIPPRRR